LLENTLLNTKEEFVYKSDK